MRKRNKFFWLLAGLSAASGLALVSCNDYFTGQDPEPDGPLAVTKFTLFDQTSRDVAVFTDTSVPDCSKAENASQPSCAFDPMTDVHGQIKSPPDPDSGAEMRVVFNKAPLLIGGMELEVIKKGMNGKPDVYTGQLTDDSAVTMACDDCSTAPAVPALTKTLFIEGSSYSYDPTVIPYGPSIILSVDTSNDPLMALEPGSTYHVAVSTKLSGRDGIPFVGDATQTKLLTITTEPFEFLRVGIGDDSDPETGDPWAYPPAHFNAYHEVLGDGASNTVTGDGTANAPYQITEMANDGVVTLYTNAGVDSSTLRATMTATATVGGTPIPVKIGINELTMDPMTMAPVCDPGTLRKIFVYPASGTWGTNSPKGAPVTVSVTGADIRDIAMDANHTAGKGKHTFSGAGSIQIKTTLSGKASADYDMKNPYLGLTADSVSSDDDCPQPGPPPDMTAPPDMTPVVDMVKRG